MKRSEMVEILRQAVQESNGDFGEYNTERAEYVLKILEEYGMKPPKERFCPVLIKTYHEWEKENDTRN